MIGASPPVKSLLGCPSSLLDASIPHFGELYSTLHFTAPNSYRDFLKEKLNSKETVFYNLLDADDLRAFEMWNKDWFEEVSKYLGYFESYIAVQVAPYLYDKHILHKFNKDDVIKNKKLNAEIYSLLLREKINKLSGGCDLKKKSLVIRYGSKFEKIYYYAGSHYLIIPPTELRSFVKCSQIKFDEIESELDITELPDNWKKCDRCYYYHHVLRNFKDNLFCDECFNICTKT